MELNGSKYQRAGAVIGEKLLEYLRVLAAEKKRQDAKKVIRQHKKRQRIDRKKAVVKQLSKLG